MLLEEVEASATFEYDDREFQYLGQDADQGYHQFYRFTPEQAEVLLTSYDSEDQLQVDDELRIFQGHPYDRLNEFAYQRGWEDLQEFDRPGYHSIDEPEYRPDLNEGLGGTLFIDDYVLPFRSKFGDAADILKSQSEDDDSVFVDYRPDFVEVAPGGSWEKFRVLPKVRGHNEVTGSKIVDRIHVLDRGAEEVHEEYHVDQLAEDHFIEELSQLEMIDESLAEVLVDEYTNLRTVSWAATSDVAHLENTYDVEPHELFEQLGEEDIYWNEQSPEAGVLHFPERRAEDLSESKQEMYFGEVLEPKEEDENPEDDSKQSGLSDF